MLLEGPRAIAVQIWLIINSVRSKSHFNQKATSVGGDVITRMTITSETLYICFRERPKPPKIRAMLGRQTIMHQVGF